MSLKKPYSAVAGQDVSDDEETEMSQMNGAGPRSPKLGRQDTNPALIRAFSELTYQQSEAAITVQNRVQSGKIRTKKEEKDELKKAYKTLAHIEDKEELQSEYGTDLVRGLSAKQVEGRLASDGYNELTPPKRDPEWLRFLKCTFDNLLSILLTLGAVATLICYGIDPHTPKDPSSLYLGIALLLVVLITGLFIFYQEGKSSNLMSALSAMKPPDIMVIRDGNKTKIEPRELVKGDICVLNMGLSSILMVSDGLML